MAHSGNRVVGYVVAAVGVVLLLALLPFYLSSGLVAPLWAIGLLLLVWIALFVLAVRWFRARPWWVLVLPFVAAAVWFGTLSAGERFLGWTA